jgi:hypothetical protein
MLNIYDPKYHDHELSKRRDFLGKSLEELQKSMLDDLDRFEQGIGYGVRYEDFIPSYQERLEEYHKIYTEANWKLISEWFNKFRDSLSDKSPSNNIRADINSIPIKEFIKSLKV